MIAWSVGMSAPVFDLGITGAPGSHGEPTFETAFSIRDLILIAGGLFLLYKATTEIHGTMQGEDHSGADKGPAAGKAAMGFRSEEHTSELQSLMRISYAVFCLKKKKSRTL